MKKGAWQKLGAAWRRFEQGWFGPADIRVYDWLRVAFAVVALANLIDLWPHRAAFFSSEGLIDHAAVAEAAGPWRLSVFQGADSPVMVTAIFIVVAIALVCLALGFWPRVMIAIVFVWQLSYTYRAFPIIHGWDILLRVEAFILLISPLGRTLGEFVMRKTGEIERLRDTVPRYGLVLTQIVLAVIYWQTVWLKAPDPAWRSGEFISQFMLSIYSRFQTPAWADWQVASALLTYATLAIETAVPLLLWNRRFRWLGFVLGFGLHLGILAVSPIWLFSLTILVPYFAFLSGEDIDAIGTFFRNRLRRVRA
ncbi:MAG: HTTM domain-containing protein [Verrucomicrobiae bacterium]|nr:HTTM domain-containing protein [Verrucomicrobiae bacterium]